jgi:predicted transcriptional regulator
MQGDSTSETGWTFIAESDEVGTIIDTILQLDPDETYSRSELAEKTDIPLKTLHLMDDVKEVVDIGLLEKHDAEGEERHYSINEDSEVFEMARKFGRSVTAARDE